ncbi:hypothetical protein [Marinoscillum sp. MHG1-6]|uniref:hypothetical protein n=1 Tax=Marinoscillum sp. MHG1-6 TaxID=2959627 RepID=UPI002157776E|nr:hypothetical protein [Marinoscillum sp. MHG1-6]
MRILTTVLSLCILLGLMSCGEEGVGFNIGKEIPVEFPVQLSGINDPKLPFVNVNPPAYTVSDTYNLSEVTGDAAESVVLKKISYEVSNVDAGEAYQMDEVSVTIRDQTTASDIGTFFIFLNEPLANKSYTQIDSTAISYTALEQALLEEHTLEVSSTFDFQELGGSVDFDFTFYFDVIAKVRD